MHGRVTTALLALAIGALAVGGLARPALAIRCDSAGARPDRLICADPALRAADAAMASAYTALRAGLPKGEQPGLLADQRQWLAERAGCVVDADGKDAADAAAIACMRAATEARRRFLDGSVPGEAAGAPRITPRFLHRPGASGQYAVEIAWPEIAGAATPALRAANAMLRQAAVGNWSRPRLGEGDHLVHQARYRVTLVTPPFASIDLSTYDDSGAAYPRTGGRALNIDLATGRTLPLAALLRPGAVDAAVKLCTAQLTDYYSQAIGEPWQPPAPAVRDVANDVANWLFFPDHAVLAFRESSIGPHALGSHDCTIDARALATMVRPDGPVAAR